MTNSLAKRTLTPEEIDKINRFTDRVNYVKNNLLDYVSTETKKGWFWTTYECSTLDEEKVKKDSHGIWDIWPYAEEEGGFCVSTYRGDALSSLLKLVHVSNDLLLGPKEADVLDYILKLEEI